MKFSLQILEEREVYFLMLLSGLEFNKLIFL